MEISCERGKSIYHLVGGGKWVAGLKMAGMGISLAGLAAGFGGEDM
jgi:hypothetical protein